MRSKADHTNTPDIPKANGVNMKEVGSLIFSAGVVEFTSIRPSVVSSNASRNLILSISGCEPAISRLTFFR